MTTGNHVADGDESLLFAEFENHKVELNECELCLNPILPNAKIYKFKSTNFNKQVNCGCYDCYIFELENKV